MKKLIDKIRNLIAVDKLEKAIEELRKVAPDLNTDYGDQLISHQAALGKNKKDSRKGLIGPEEENKTRTRIRYAVLDLLSELEQIGSPPVPALPAENQPTVFISYNHGDSDVAQKLKKTLEQNGIAVRIDSEAMKAGEDIKSFIERSIEETTITLSIVSNNSLLSAWVAMETINTFYLEKFKRDKKLTACYLDDDFFKPRFRLEATQKIDAKIQEIDELIPEYIENKLDTIDLNNEKSRLHQLRNNLGEILLRLKETLTLDIRNDQYDKSLSRIIETITSPSRVSPI
ncbi:TIR domain-containing protein [Desulfosarcina ovata]|nr:TIR domain-containing protein [Desulfosarcina ovata]